MRTEREIRMSRYDKTYDRIIALAYFHRYGLCLLILAMLLFRSAVGFIFAWSGGFIAYGIWTLVGYKRRWRHIFCSFQNARRERMTPYNTGWGQIKKSEIYGTFYGSLILGVVFLFGVIVYS